MKGNWDYNRCITVLSEELLLLNRIFTIQSAVRQAVLSKEWIDFDWKMAEIRQIGSDFNELDNERSSLFNSLSGMVFGYYDEKTAKKSIIPPFYTLVSKLPEDERRELSRLYRALKIETLRMQALNESFINYINEARIAASSYLEAAYPCRWSKVYNRKGNKTDQDFKSMIFNRHI